MKNNFKTRSKIQIKLQQLEQLKIKENRKVRLAIYDIF